MNFIHFDGSCLEDVGDERRALHKTPMPLSGRGAHKAVQPHCGPEEVTTDVIRGRSLVCLLLEHLHVALLTSRWASWSHAVSRGRTRDLCGASHMVNPSNVGVVMQHARSILEAADTSGTMLTGNVRHGIAMSGGGAVMRRARAERSTPPVTPPSRLSKPASSSPHVSPPDFLPLFIP